MTPAEIEAAQAQVPRIDVRAGADGIVRARGLTRARCANESDVLELLARGAAMRATAATRMNQHSSRSHAVLTLELIRERPSPASVPSVPAAGSSLGRASTNMSNNHKGKSSGSSGSIVTCAKLHLVDLAGSERAKRTGTAGARFKESVRINEVRILNL
jgi:kinesin family protein 4/21/27